MIVMKGQKISINVYKLLGNTILCGVAAVAESEDDDTLLYEGIAQKKSVDWD
jgi:hypothetical protein